MKIWKQFIEKRISEGYRLGSPAPNRPDRLTVKPDDWDEKTWDYYNQLIDDAHYTHQQAYSMATQWQMGNT
jgi:hypothetical protein